MKPTTRTDLPDQSGPGAPGISGRDADGVVALAAGEIRWKWPGIFSVQRPAGVQISAIAFAVAAALAPFLTGEANLYVLNLAIVDAVAIVGVSLLFRYTGLITIGQAAVQAVGAYACAITISHWGVPIIGAVFLGGIAGGVLGLIIAAASVRLAGPYFAVLTLGLGGFVSSLILLFPQLTGGSGGISAPSFEVFGLTSAASTYWLTLLFFLVIIAMLHVFNRTKYAKSLLLAKGRAPAAKSIGANVVVLRLTTATLCNVLAGISGGLLVITAGFASSDSFTFIQSVLMLAGAIIGGTISLWGAAIGGLVVVGVPHLLAASPEVSVFVLGGGMVLALAVRPAGLASIPAAVRGWIRHKRTGGAKGEVSR